MGWRRGFVVFMVAAVLVGVTGCGVSPQNSDDPEGRLMGTRSAVVIFEDFLNTMEDTVQASGLDFPDWDRNNTAGFTAKACTQDESGRAYRTQIEGAASPDPRAAAQAMREHFEAKGYVIGNIIDNTKKTSGEGVLLNATTPNGMLVQFFPSKNGSFIKVVSDCTLDPAAAEPTT